MSETTPANLLPVIIGGPGEYVTRDGSRVTIREVRESSPDVTAFGAKGSVWRMFRGKIRPRGHDIWHVSGLYVALGQHPKDIVGRWPEEGEKTDAE